MNANKIRPFLYVLVVFAAAFYFWQMQSSGRSAQGNQPMPKKVNRDVQIHQQKKIKNWTWFQDKKENFKLKYPDHWTLQDNSADDRLIRADLSDGDTAGLQVRVQKGVTGDFGNFAEAYMTQFMNGMKSHWKGSIEVMDSGFERIGKHDGFRTSLVMTRGDGQKWFLKEFLWKSGDTVYIFQAGAKWEQIHIYEPIFDKIAGSFALGE